MTRTGGHTGHYRFTQRIATEPGLKGKIKDLYVLHDLTLKDIATRYGTGSTQIKAILNDQGVVLNKKRSNTRGIT
jgi:hypothetical protein